MVEWILGCFICGNCGEGYYDMFKLIVIVGICDKCGFIDMKWCVDDKVEIVVQCLMVYYVQIVLLIVYYENVGVFMCIDVMGVIEEIVVNLSVVVIKIMGQSLIKILMWVGGKMKEDFLVMF